MSNRRFRWALAAALGLLAIVLISESTVVGTIEASPDDRTAIVVGAAQRDQILKEMRGLLEAVQLIIVANNAGDLNAVAIASRKVGRANMSPRSAEFASRLPMGFRKLGMDTHVRFDQLALDAEQIGSMEQVSQQLGELAGNCVACHSTYRLETSDAE